MYLHLYIIIDTVPNSTALYIHAILSVWSTYSGWLASRIVYQWQNASCKGLRSFASLACFIITLFDETFHRHVALIYCRVGHILANKTWKAARYLPCYRLFYCLVDLFSYLLIQRLSFITSIFLCTSTLSLSLISMQLLAWFDCESMTGPFCVKHCSSWFDYNKLLLTTILAPNSSVVVNLFLHLPIQFFNFLTAVLLTSFITEQCLSNIFYFSFFHWPFIYLNFHQRQIHCEVYFTKP
jgi:hypothetical protein